jgi:23S rRNA (uridine2552-2'-O)-methyltransferase
MNYRCRSSFKLVEINDKHKFLKPGGVVVDVGCAPGSWSQICVKAVNSDGADKEKPKGVVIGIDKLQIYPIEGATFLGNTDFTTPKAQEKVKSLLDGRLVNCVLSDMAPNATGIRSLDQDGIMELVFSVLKFAEQVSAPGAILLVKIWENGDRHKFEKAVHELYEYCKVIKPNASRSDSAETFIIAKGFKKSQSQLIDV